MSIEDTISGLRGWVRYNLSDGKWELDGLLAALDVVEKAAVVRRRWPKSSPGSELEALDLALQTLEQTGDSE